jgi:hypothetical protein
MDDLMKIKKIEFHLKDNKFIKKIELYPQDRLNYIPDVFQWLDSHIQEAIEKMYKLSPKKLRKLQKRMKRHDLTLDWRKHNGTRTRS